MRRLVAISCIILIVGVLDLHAQEEQKWHGQWSGQWRSFYLGTFNKDSLKDFHGLATGGKLKYVQSIGKHLQLGGAVYTAINLGVQDLAIPDPSTNRVSRYEAGLFDVQDLDDYWIIYPGELYVQIAVQNHQLTIGRMKIKSPFINGQDGRMIPTLEQGLWYKFNPEGITMQGGVFNRIAPRSSDGFKRIGESIGIYPVGRNIDGSRSLYANNTSSSFIGLFNVDYKPSKSLKIALWNYYVDNIFNTLYIKPTYQLGKKGPQLSVEWLHQNRVGNGGNAIDSLRYFQDRQANIIGAQLSTKIGKAKLSIGYDHITSGGRFLFPREWGREFLFSFQKRERSEGSANNHAVMIALNQSWNFESQKIRSIFSIGHHWKPSVTNAADNKYAQPNYTHINWDLFYQTEHLKGFKPELLLTYKIGSGNYPENPNFILNKVDMFQVNFVLNYEF